VLFFDEVVYQPGKSPDASMLDAGVFQWMELEVDARGCISKTDIQKAVTSMWRSLTPETPVRVADRVRRNVVNTLHIKGGNIYDKRGDPSCERVNERADKRARLV
jgi:hypothetical protein